MGNWDSWNIRPENPTSTLQNISTKHSLLKYPFHQHVGTVPGWCLDVCDLAATIHEPAATAQPSKMTAEIVLQTKKNNTCQMRSTWMQKEKQTKIVIF
jgi:hypothetical protein